MRFEFSDTIAGYVVSYNRENRTVVMKTSDNREFSVRLKDTTYAKVLRNFNEDYIDCTGQMENYLTPGRYFTVYGTFYGADSGIYEAHELNFPGRDPEEFRFEESDWWVNQMKAIADFFIKAQFDGPDSIDYSKYRTMISITGQKMGTNRQEIDTISRLVYGFASAYLLSGEDRFLEAAEKGTAYLKDNCSIYDSKRDMVYWNHAIDIEDGERKPILPSQFGDDYGAMPLYEQIYALAGPTQTYRINGDPAVLENIEKTINFFDRCYLDRNIEGYFSHVDPEKFDPCHESLGQNRAKKNWNSVGDHAPAYLINLYLATGEEKYKKFLEYTADCIVRHFQDYENSAFVQERFFENWNKDQTWGWQQNRAIVGHNLKIAWNLMRINNVIPKKEYVEMAERIAELMPKHGMDKQRGGWYDGVERESEYNGINRFAWHDRKAWWQQEQGILAYQILYGVLKKDQYLKYARESSSFYNNFFPDLDNGGVYFNTFADGMPYLLGNERHKGSHSMSGYHSIELGYLATVYTNLLHTGNPVDLHFKPQVNGFENRELRVEPDILPQKQVKITGVWIDGSPWNRYDEKKLTVELPEVNHRPKVKVRIAAV